ncbi:MAG TPA: histidine triad nucleotide-binding protein [Oligoflexia bacterium]|nr:histidine triad nucleotide-binding protein [Oligoflexia bacterium]HMR24188.1 histidine triad nucleotide-binding protein [Oligoflexia bacterium]
MTLFEKIIAKELPATILYEDEQCICIKDISPQAKVHALLIPKQVIPSLNDLTQDHQNLIAHLMLQIPKIASDLGLSEAGYRVVNNIGQYGRQSVQHLHFHILGGEQLSGNFA